MPPMKTAAKKAPGKPQAPKKPSTRSKTGNSACSQAASNWQLAIRGKAPLDPTTYATLGKCRAQARAAKSADDRADMGYNLSEQGRTALKGRLQKRFDQGLITQKSRQDRLKTLLAERKAKQAQPVSQAQTNKVAQESKQPIRQPRSPEIAEKRNLIAAKIKEAYRRQQDHPQYNDFLVTGPALRDVKSIPKVGYRKSVKDAEYEIENRSGGYGVSRTLTNDRQIYIRINKAEEAGARKATRDAIARRDAPAPAPATKPTDKATPGENKIPESKQVQAMKNKLERMKGQFDSKIEDWYGQTRGHGGTPFIMDNSKGRAQYKRHQKGDESLRNLDKAIKEQEEKIQTAQYRHIRRHTQTKKSEKFIEKNPVSPGLQYLEQKGLVKSWPKKPEVHFVQGLDKTALITVDGRVGVSRGYNGGSTENFLAAKRLASIANSYNRTQSLVSSVRQKPGYGVARAIAAKNRELVGLKIRDKGTVTAKPAPAPTTKPTGKATPTALPSRTVEDARKDRFQRAKEAGIQSNPVARSWKARSLRESRNNTRTSPEGRSTRKQAAEILISLRSQGSIGRGLASVIRDDALVRRSWGYTGDNKRELVKFGPLGNAKKIIEQSQSVRGKTENSFADAQFRAKELLTPTGKLSQANVNKSTWVNALTMGGARTQAEALSERVKMLRSSASAALKQLRVLNRASVQQSSYIAKPEFFRGENNNYIQQLKVAMQGKRK